MLLLPPLAGGQTALAQEVRAQTPLIMSPAKLFSFADEARDRGNFSVAETAYRALSENPDIEIRTEARFRLALMLADRMDRPRDAAVLLRQILDEKPEAARVRIELARLHAKMCNYDIARRELRAAEAIGLPPEVERTVHFYSTSLSSRKQFGLNFEISLAPDNNINRSTRSETLGTVLGDFDLSEDARARSGLGISTQMQAWGRMALGPQLSMITRISSKGDFFRKSSFDDTELSIELGPQLNSGRDAINVAAITSWRWYGLKPYAYSYGANARLSHSFDKKSQLRIDGAYVHSDDKHNDLRNADSYTLAVGADRAIGGRTGVGLRASGQRSVASDPVFSTASGALTSYVFQEIGKTTLVASGGYQHLEADARQFLYPRRRIDDQFSAGLAGTFRSLRTGRLAPMVRLNYERNFSTVGIYEYRRLSAEMGVTAAF